MSDSKKFYSQHGEDRWIVEHVDFELTGRGVFVEVGAHDGVSDSNTFYFEQAGWTGLCIEANPALWDRLAANRLCGIGRYAVGGDRGRTFDVHPNDKWSGFGRGGRPITVPVKSLADALSEAGIGGIDLLSLDVEGSELDVWGTFDHNLHKPKIVIVEYDTQPLPSAESRLMDAFYSLPYRMVHRSIGNLIFERLP